MTLYSVYRRVRLSDPDLVEWYYDEGILCVYSDSAEWISEPDISIELHNSRGSFPDTWEKLL